MKSQTIALALVVLASGACVACSSSSGSGGASDSGAPSDASKSGDAAVMNCVPTTAQNNAVGVGGYCTSGGGQCKTPDGSTTICTADFMGMGVPPGAWFCTDECNPDAGANACGAGGPPCTTIKNANLSVCVPNSCMAFVTAFEADGGSL